MNNSFVNSKSSKPLVKGSDIRLFTELGFIAALNGQVVPALRIFESLRILRPYDGFPYIGMSIAYLSVGAFKFAIELLREALANAGNDREDLQLYLALALDRGGQKDLAEKALSSLEESSELSEKQADLIRAIRNQTRSAPGHSGLPKPAKITDLSPHAFG